MVINEHPTEAEYISEKPGANPTKMSEEWKRVHVRQSQYCLQIVKYKNTECWLLFQLGLQLILKDIFLSPLIPVIQTAEGLKVVSTTFLIICFACLKESICEAKKNVFYFTLKAVFILEIIKF